MTGDPRAAPKKAGRLHWPAKVGPRWLFSGVGVLALAASGAGLAINLWMLRSTRAAIFLSPEDVPPRELGIVPGARVHPDGRPSPALDDRLLAAAELYHAGRVRRILVSGDGAAPEYDEVLAMRRRLEELGVPPGDVLTDRLGLRTIDTMRRAARIYGVSRAVVCTQDFHLPRSLFLARREGIDAVGLVADRRVYPREAWFRFREMAARVMAFLER